MQFLVNGVSGDTPGSFPAIGYCNRLNTFMAISGNRRGGRRSKGERHLVGARMPVQDANKLRTVAEAEGSTVSDYVARIMHEHLMTIDVNSLHGQEALPISRAS
jgi:hypothetical protein